jgi:hypothetical protein
MVEQEVVHLPERALLGRRLGRLRRLLRVRVDVVERQVPPDIGDVAEVAQQLAHDGLRLAAIRTLEVAVLDDGDRGSTGPRTWSRSGSNGSARSTMRSGVPRSARIRALRGSRFVAIERSQVTRPLREPR